MGLIKVQVVINRSLIGEDVAVNTWALTSPSATPDEVEGTTAALTVLGCYNAAEGLRTLMHPSHVIDRVKAYNAAAVDAGPIYDTDQNLPGTAADALLPLQSAMSITFKTAIRKRWGRIYLPGLTIGAVGPDGQWTNGACARATGNVKFQFHDLLPAGWAHVVDQAAGSPSTASTPVVSVTTDSVPDVIRKRRAEFVRFRASEVY